MNYTVQTTLCPHPIRIFSENALLAIQAAFPDNTNTYAAELETPMRNKDIYLLSGVDRSFIFLISIDLPQVPKLSFPKRF